jgi:hypothetical protein
MAAAAPGPLRRVGRRPMGCSTDGPQARAIRPQPGRGASEDRARDYWNNRQGSGQPRPRPRAQPVAMRSALPGAGPGRQMRTGRGTCRCRSRNHVRRRNGHSRSHRGGCPRRPRQLPRRQAGWRARTPDLTRTSGAAPGGARQLGCGCDSAWRDHHGKHPHRGQPFPAHSFSAGNQQRRLWIVACSGRLIRRRPGPAAGPGRRAGGCLPRRTPRARAP